MSQSADSGERRGVGRKPGVSESTIANGLRWIELLEYGATADSIARCEGIARTTVYEAMRKARPLAVVAPEPGPGAGAVPEPYAPPKPKMGEGTLLRRAFAAIRNVRAFKGLLNAETREFWIEAMIEIRAMAEDGISLTFGQPGDVYQDQDEFLSVFEGITDTQLQKLFRHSMLVDLEGQGVALPHHWDIRGKPNRQQRRATAAASNTYQLSVLRGADASGADAAGAIYPDSGAIYPDSESGKIRDLSGQPSAIYPDSSGVASAAAADAVVQENHELSSSNSSNSRAHASPDKLPKNPDGESGLIAGGESGLIQEAAPAGPDLADLAAELTALARPGSPTSAKDIGAVQKWQQQGDTAEAMRSTIAALMKSRSGAAVSSLTYFDKPMAEARQVRRSAERNGTAPAPAPPKPDPAAEAAEAAAEEAACAGTDAAGEFARVRRRVRKLVGAPNFRSWLSSMAAGPVVDDEATVLLKNTFLRDRARTDFGDQITAAWRAENPAVQRVVFETAERRH